jgi:hypothetical protein
LGCDQKDESYANTTDKIKSTLNQYRNSGAECKRCDYRENLLVKKKMRVSYDIAS